MRPIRGGFSERSVRWLGISLIAAGLVFPFAVLLIRAARWEPAAPVAEDAVELRPEMVILPAGTFEMGSPEDEPGRFDDERLHTVTLTRPFLLSRTEVTQGQYAAVMGERPVEDRTGSFGDRCREAGVGDDLPVVCVDWLEAVRYCNELSRREGLAPAYSDDGDNVQWSREAPGYRLPTEAEWEYAARAGTRTTWVGTDRQEEVCDYSNVADASFGAAFEIDSETGLFPCDDSFPRLAPAGTLEDNRWRLFSLGGNAAEWVWDGHSPYSAGPVEDPSANRASSRVIRGGSWRYDPRVVRCANRSGDARSTRFSGLGFRVARSLYSAL